jgi:hypothetical protein
MSAESLSIDRRGFLASAAAVGASSLLATAPQAGTEDGAIRPFHVNVPEEQLLDLRRRIAATRWPDRETIMDETQGVQLGTIQKLARYWTTGHDWRKVEARLNALPQFMTEIDGLDIGVADKAESLTGCKSLYRQLPVFGRLAYPERAEVTKHDMPGRKSPGCPAAVSQR